MKSLILGMMMTLISTMTLAGETGLLTKKKPVRF